MFPVLIDLCVCYSSYSKVIHINNRIFFSPKKAIPFHSDGQTLFKSVVWCYCFVRLLQQVYSRSKFNSFIAKVDLRLRNGLHVLCRTTIKFAPTQFIPYYPQPSYFWVSGNSVKLKSSNYWATSEETVDIALGWWAVRRGRTLGWWAVTIGRTLGWWAVTRGRTLGWWTVKRGRTLGWWAVTRGRTLGWWAVTRGRTLGWWVDKRGRTLGWWAVTRGRT